VPSLLFTAVLVAVALSITGVAGLTVYRLFTSQMPTPEHKPRSSPGGK
jgi:hypothetical protein